MADGPPSPSLERLITESGRQAGPLVWEFTRVAAAVQLDQYQRKASDTSLITRSTALWVLMDLDRDIRAALESGGLSHAQLGNILSIPTGQTWQGPETPELHGYFLRAIREYLDELPSQRSDVLLADLALAIIRASQEDPRGLLHNRLRDLKVDYRVIITALDKLIPVTVRRDPDNTAGPPPLSESMQSIAQELSPAQSSSDGNRDVTAYEIALAIGRRHPEYASDLLGAAAFRVPPTVLRQPWAEWANSVGRLYDRDIVAQTRHEVLDGRLFLAGLGLIDSSLRAELDRLGVWGPLAVEVDENAAPQGSQLRSLLRAVQFGYGYQSDLASGQDQLGIQGEVNAVCEVILDPAVIPPLAVGLFGEWGSGKSFFMGKMRERVAERTLLASESPSDGSQKIPNVVQIRFNAWHYADTSLWASLAVEIFERLADPEPVSLEEREKWLRDRGDAGRAERKKLLEQLETYRDAKAALDVGLQRLEDKRLDADNRREDARRRREDAAKTQLTDIAGALATNEQVQEKIGDVAGELGLSPSAGELIGLGAELRTTAGYLPWVWRLVQHKTLAIALAAAFLILTLVTAVLTLRGGWAWLGSLATAAGSISAAVVAAAKLVRPAAQKVNRALAKVEEAITTASAVEAELRAKRSQEERELELKLAQINDEITEATLAIAALDEKIATTKADADALTVGRKLYDFLADRAAGYQKHQGVVGMLHRDFRFLDAQLRAYRASPDAAQPLPRIDRVILYIDDLDRCPPAKVLEVLEAVHLLLALELFVVVVGVDPRWLQRSLRHQYRELVTGGEPGADPYLRAMPIEYLEKIFQLPLTLPAMAPLAYARLIASLAPKMAGPEPTEATVAATANRPPMTDTPGADRAPTRAPLEVQPGSSASGEAGQPIDLTRAEIEFAQQLGALVDSPRAAKRLMNTYRLIRATQNVGSRWRFLGDGRQAGEYQAVLTLLAVAAGYPALADRLLLALQEGATRIGVNRWPDFVSALAPAAGTRAAGRLVPQILTERSPNSDAARSELTAWTKLHEGLSAGLTGNRLTDLEPYQRWGRVVARFSFTL